MFTKIARLDKIPVYILSDSWKYSNKKIQLEKRDLKEIWKKNPRKIKIQNFAFELVKKQDITGIISEFGNLPYDEFLKRVK